MSSGWDAGRRQDSYFSRCTQTSDYEVFKEKQRWKKIAEYLFEISPSGSYTSDIAYNVKTTPTNVIGALRGMNTRYRDDESLLSLNIVEQIDGGKNVKIYKLTDFGREILLSMKDRR